MARRNKRTSYEQYQIYLDMMEFNPVLASGRASRHEDLMKWKQLSDKLNKCRTGPSLEPEEWRKRLNDWKNTTRCKYRRITMSPGAKLSLSPLENRALGIFGGSADVSTVVIDDSTEYLDEELVESYAESSEDASPPPKAIRISEGPPRKVKQVPVQYKERPPTKIINGQLPVKRVRVQVPQQLYEVKSSLRNDTPTYAQEIEKQLQRIADIHSAGLQFKIACFKYSNPGFEYSSPEL
ncbi:uncharacterized protein LOC117579227 isoform X3 [Drosophila guanche]|uniref:Regulatory protein zeste n=1 Tax=Drosophila guanche TaxID=7266 RepID=A0A3B0IZK5_DROGU|nr:uncharacterized protein LOC117579227 isoform X3 [Drosophila guanche]SPP73655.1 Hypothetical predicted protein [Drosophila guanche]